MPLGIAKILYINILEILKLVKKIRNKNQTVSFNQIMKNAFKIFILFCYSLVSLFLSMDDILTLQDMPIMYQNCKEHQQHDISSLDFITDHLINIDGIFYKHNHEGEQEPHKDFHFTHRHSVTIYFQELKKIEFNNVNPILENKIIIFKYIKLNYSFNPFNSAFRPPIIA